MSGIMLDTSLPYEPLDPYHPDYVERIKDARRRGVWPYNITGAT